MSVLEKLTEGIVDRDLQKEGAALLSKWEATGLLEGLGQDRHKDTMARLLENQAKELLREASSMQGGDVEGFAAVAFPIVRRVFGGLIANDLVSVQPMSLPSGLIFFLDFTTDAVDGPGGIGFDGGDSLYGGNVVGQQLTNGVQLDYLSQASMGTAAQNDLDEGFYNLTTGYASPTGSVPAQLANTFTAHDCNNPGSGLANVCRIDLTPGAVTEAEKRVLRYDPDVLALGAGHSALVFSCTVASFENVGVNGEFLNRDNLSAIELGRTAPDNAPQLVRRLTTLGSAANHRSEIAWNNTETDVYFVFVGQDADITSLAATADDDGGTVMTNTVATTFPLADNFNGVPAAGAGNAIGAVAGTTTWGLENNVDIPEIDIQVDSISVTAITKKLKAKWTPELGQDLNAYHNLDAEVELTSILSEQIALEIDREILNDLVVGATAATLFWARSPGLFVHRSTGAEIGATAAAPDFTGTVSEWYETLAETINDVSAQIHRKTLRGGANFIVTSPEVANILEFTSGFRASVTHDDDRGTVGTVKVGSQSKKWDVYVDPYFPRNLVLVGRKGASFLESGYVYAPYVPLQVTPTIFGIEDFVPRKGVMTRYAKQMVRPDMYGLVVVRGLLGESGSS